MSDLKTPGEDRHSDLSVQTPPGSPVTRGADETPRRESQLQAASERLRRRRRRVLVIHDAHGVLQWIGRLWQDAGEEYDFLVMTDVPAATLRLREAVWDIFMFDESAFGLLSWLAPEERTTVAARSLVVTMLDSAGPVALSGASTISIARLNSRTLKNALDRLAVRSGAKATTPTASDAGVAVDAGAVEPALTDAAAALVELSQLLPAVLPGTRQDREPEALIGQAENVEELRRLLVELCRTGISAVRASQRLEVRWQVRPPDE
jgi:hypothetical protein